MISHDDPAAIRVAVDSMASANALQSKTVGFKRMHKFAG